MLPYLIAGAIGYVVAKLFEDETPKFADGGSVLLAPNGKPSNLTPEQYELVRTDAFKNWFGDWENSPETASKVVDENGEPMVLYHGTYENFNVFKSKKNFFTPSKQSALWFSKVHRTSKGEPKVYEVFLNSKKLFNPFNLKENEKKSITILVENHDNKNDFYEDFDFFKNDWDMNHLSDSEFNLKIIQHKNDTSYTIIESRIFQDWLMKNKYDGFMVGESDFETPNYAVFYSNQIKLADGTNTTFDSNNPDIRFDGGGRVSNYKQFYDNLQIEDGSKYIGQKFADVFPLFRRKQTSPADIRILLKEYNNLLSRLENDNYTTKGLKTADLNRLEQRQKYIDKNKYLSRFYLDPSGRIINFDNSDNAYASGGGIDSYYEELKPEVDYYSVNYDDMDGQKFRDNIFDTLTEAKELFNKLCVTGKTFERVDINTIELVAFYENGLYEVLDSKAFINTYPKFLNNLQIEDGSKYIGQKFTDVFPYLKRSDFTPYKFKIKVKRYNNILRRLSEDNYSTKSMKTADLNRLEKIEPTIEKVKYLSKFFCDNSKTILSFDN